MSLTLLSQMSAPVLAATLWIDPPASQYRHPRTPVTRVPRQPWRSRVKAMIRPLVPVRVRSKVRLVVISSNAAPTRPAAESPQSDARRAA